MKNSPATTFICCFFLASSIFAQQAIVDSLITMIPETTGDTDLVNLYNDISFYTYRMNPDECLKYAEKGFELATKIGFDRG